MNSYAFSDMPHQYDGLGSWDEALYMLPTGPDLVPLDAQIISPVLGEAFSVPEVTAPDGYVQSNNHWHGQTQGQHHTALQAQALHQQQTQALQAHLASGYAPGGAGMPVHPLMQQPGHFQSIPGMPYAGEFGAPFGLHAWEASNRTHAAASADGPAALAPDQHSPQPQGRPAHAQKASGTAAGSVDPAATRPANSQLPHTHQQPRAGPGTAVQGSVPQHLLAAGVPHSPGYLTLYLGCRAGWRPVVLAHTQLEGNGRSL